MVVVAVMTDGELLEMSRAYRWIMENGGLERVRLRHGDGIEFGKLVHWIAERVGVSTEDLDSHDAAGKIEEELDGRLPPIGGCARRHSNEDGGGGFRDPSYYTDQAVETCIKQDLIADHLERAGVPARHIKDASTAVKYIDRLGEKDSIEADSFKAANYLYRFMTGSFIGREVEDADE